MRIFTLLILMLLPSQAFAIVNAEDIDFSDAEGFGGKIAASAGGNSGNSSKFTSEANTRLVWRHGPHTELAAASYSYGKSRGVRDTNKAFAHLRHRYRFVDHWEVEAFAQAQQNEFALLKLRTLFGGGLRWSTHNDDWSAAIGAGSFYERERLKPAANEPVSKLWRGNAYLSLGYRLNDHVAFANTVYYQPAWKQPADYRLLDDGSLSVGLTESIDLKLTVELAKDSRPPLGVKALDTAYKTGLEMHF